MESTSPSSRRSRASRRPTAGDDRKQQTAAPGFSAHGNLSLRSPLGASAEGPGASLFGFSGEDLTPFDLKPHAASKKRESKPPPPTSPVKMLVRSPLEVQASLRNRSLKAKASPLSRALHEGVGQPFYDPARPPGSAFDDGPEAFEAGEGEGESEGGLTDHQGLMHVGTTQLRAAGAETATGTGGFGLELSVSRDGPLGSAGPDSHQTFLSMSMESNTSMGDQSCFFENEALLRYGSWGWQRWWSWWGWQRGWGWWGW